MNYTVHAVMYLYYALACVKIRLCPPVWVTILQVLVMSYRYCSSVLSQIPGMKSRFSPVLIVQF